MILFVEYYDSGDDQRQEEILKCLKINIENPAFSKVVVFSEQKEGIDSLDVEIVFSKRLKFSDVLRKGSESSETLVLANSDIAFDDSASLLDEVPNNVAYCVSRIDILADGGSQPFFRPDSQDVWAFKLNGETDFEAVDFYLGVPGCDNSFAFHLSESFGFELANPCLSINCFHHHLSNFRSYDIDNVDRVPPPYLHVYPSKVI